MEIYQGKSISGGIAIGRICVYRGRDPGVERCEIKDVPGELLRLERAREAAADQLEGLYAKACAKTGKARASIFRAHKVMLEDEAYLGGIRSMIQKERVNAAYAVFVTGILFADTFAAMEDAGMRARSADVRDVSGRLIRLLEGVEENRIRLEHPAILLAEDLSPSETMRLETEGLLALVLKKGAVNSHTAILARSLDIPALVQTGIGPLAECDGMLAIADGSEGKLILDPDPGTLEKMQERKRRYEKEQETLRSLVGQNAVSKDGRSLAVYANVGSLKEVEQAIYNDAGGIGLFRSEFLFLGKNGWPSEEEQFIVYRDALQRMGGRTVAIRTLDIGADKSEPYMGLPEEENPALGCRAIRFCLKHEEVFRVQLRAICRAAAYGNCGVLLPMIVSPEEVRQVRGILKEIRDGLAEKGIPFGPLALGVMIETPAAALMSRELAKEADFFSIGTNDLTQYALAMDRQNPELERYFDAKHPAVLRLIEMTVDSGHQAGIQVGICGELAADPEMTGRFLEMGVDILSVLPSKILPVRKAVLSA